MIWYFSDKSLWKIKKTNSAVVLKIIVKTKKKLVLKLREIMEKTITIAIVYTQIKSVVVRI